MELRELAERVLFSTSLEEKLACPKTVTDDQPGAPIAPPAMPGRPKELVFKATGAARGEFPGTRHLEQQSERGRLLHFFANHELLATELMALVLLRFPDAPAAFRKGVFETLKDEQEHTRLYIERMRSGGVFFGDLPVSGYFWRAVSGMENPIDYVAGLSLTFEQANLDFARHYSDCFAQVGDGDSAKLLQKIHRDEIGHVAYGLKWFRRWKNPSESDWEAFCRHLKFPLSPSRAKGFSLNVEGRRAAGLDVDFIEHLNVFSQSKGRTPTVFVFNPLAEARLAGGKGYSPTKHQAQLTRDLTNLPQFLCRQDDIVLVEQRPSVHFLSGLKEAGFVLPEFVEKDGSARLTHRKLGGLRPWAWAPDSVELFRPLFRNIAPAPLAPEQCFNDGIAPLYGKAWSAAFLKNFLASRASDWLCSAAEVGVAVNSLPAALEAIAAIRARGQHKVVVKDSVGVAGSNALRLFEPTLLESQRRWLVNLLDAGRTLVVEPWLERALDFSVQLEMSTHGLKPRGYTGLINDRKGQFQANWAEPKFERLFPAAVLSGFGSHNRIQRLYADLLAVLEQELRSVGFVGPLGIDAFVYRTPTGQLRLKPVVEINPRYTMGRVTVELMKHVCPGSFGLFRLVNRTQARAEGCEDFSAFERKLDVQHPLQVEGESPLIREGALCLNDPGQAQVCLAVFFVCRDVTAFHRLAGFSPAPLVNVSR